MHLKEKAEVITITGQNKLGQETPHSAFIVSVSKPVTFVNEATNSEFIALIADKLQLQLKSSEVANF